MKKKRILVIEGNSKGKSLCRSIASSYVKGARNSKHEVKIANLHDLIFNPILDEGYDSKQKLEKDLVKIRENILWANHLVFVYPIWWGSFPAEFKGFIDRVFLPGFAFKYEKKSLLPKKLLKGKSARMITTRGGPRIFYFGSLSFPGMILRRFVLHFCGVRQVRSTNFYSITKVSKERADKILKKSFNLGARGK